MNRSTFRVALIATIIALCALGCGGSKMLSEGSALMSSLGSNPNLSTFTNLLKTPGLDKLLGSATKSPFTLLAPTNDAMSSMGATGVSDLTKPDNLNQLANLVKNQIVPGKQTAADLMKGGMSSAGGSPVNLSGANLGSMISNDKFNIIPIDKILK
jgi:uncharacterized surface protein with fasciclin (FAS1) repeats